MEINLNHGYIRSYIQQQWMLYRKRKRQAERSINFTDYEGESETTVEFEDDREEFKPEEQIDYKETQKAVLGFMDELSSPQRMAMMSILL